MEDPDFFSDTRIAIVGLGLIGGSLALGLRGRCKSLLAVDPNLETHKLAIEHKIVDQISADPALILSQADLIILAAPVNVIIDLIPRLPTLHPGACVVLDLGSTKDDICKQLNKLPERFETIGGHPMSGKAVDGLAHADADLFRAAPFAFTPLPRTSQRALDTADNLASLLGAIALWVGPKTHDSWVASTSHLPYLLATALVLATETEASHLVGPGFRSSSRLAGSPSSVMLPILETNQEQVLQALADFRHQLDQLEDLLTKQDFQQLKARLDVGAAHKALLTGT